MKNITFALAALAAAGSGSAYAQSFADPFIELSIGNVEELNSPSGNRATTGGGAGETYGLSGGFANVVSGLDVRVDYFRSGLDFLALADDLEAHGLFVDFLLTFPISGETVKFYAGPGIGALKGRFDGPCNFCGPGVTSGEDTNIAWQVVAGLRAQLSGPFGVFVEGRYVTSEELEIRPTFKPEYEAAVALAGARFQF